MPEEKVVQEKPVPKNLLKGLKRPSSIEFITEEVNENYGKFIAEPFEKGMGTTIGNSLRRTLMSYIEGYGIISVEIKGVSHEFDSIPGVRESVAHFLLNLRKVRVRIDDDNGMVVDVSKKGPGYLMASDFEVNNKIKVFNPDVVVAHLNEDADIELSIRIDKGRGYLPSEEIKKLISGVSVLPLDVLFSPITKVNFQVEVTRVKQYADYDKLILEIWTDKSIAPEDALAYAAKILKEHFTVFINFDETKYKSNATFDEMDERIKTILKLSVEELDISVRSLVTVKNLDILTVRDLCVKYEDNLQKSKYYSDKVLLELKSKLNELGLRFGMREFME